MATIAQARTALAAALSTVDGVTATARPAPGITPVTGDGWVEVGQVEPVDYTGCLAQMRCVVILGADQALADESYETDVLDLIDAVTSADIPTTGIRAEFASISVGQAVSALLYAALITVSVEVE